MSNSPRRADRRIHRLDDAWATIDAPGGVPVELCASSDVPVEPAAVDELLTLLETSTTLERLGARIERVVLTPDVHKGAGIPIGTVLRTTGALLPQAVGNDVNCGMRLEVTGLAAADVRRAGDLEARLRRIFFEGGRGIALRPAEREALLVEGLAGLGAGADELARVHGGGCWPGGSAAAFADWVASAGRDGEATYDSVIGSIGGGNHFAEVQEVVAVADPAAAWAWGLRPGRVTTMVHSGSLSLGHVANRMAALLTRSLWPRGLARPANGVLPLPLDEASEPARARWLGAFAGAANFALGNRRMLARMLAEGLGTTGTELVWDAPHNLLWPTVDVDGRITGALHRKGATPAGGPAPGLPFGEPVIVPGSMGAASWIMRGLGNPRSLASASHGAGRRVARGALGRGGDAELDAFLRDFRVVTPLDHRDPRLAGRGDVLAAWRRELKQEAPWAYKDVAAVVRSLEAAGVAAPVAELRPLLTVKA
jgi:tRNA-splicing ligase RtcB